MGQRLTSRVGEVGLVPFVDETDARINQQSVEQRLGGQGRVSTGSNPVVPTTLKLPKNCLIIHLVDRGERAAFGRLAEGD